MELALEALVAIRDQCCTDDCNEPGPWDEHNHTVKPGIIARDALRKITGRIEPESLWGDGTGGPEKPFKRKVRGAKL